MSDTIRMGIIGAGANTRLRHIPLFQAIDGVEVATVCNRSRESSQKAAEEFNIPKVAESWKDIIADDGIDAVCIGTWPYMHAEVSVAALRAGKHVLTEARMARNLNEAKAMQEAALANPGLVAQIVASPFSLDIDDIVKGMIDDGTLGAIREICMTHTGAQFVKSDTPMTWRQDIELSGYNVLTLGIFYEMIQRWIEGDPLWVTADAAVFTTHRKHADTGEPGEVKIPDSVSFLGKYASGTRLIGHLSGVESGRSRMETRLNGANGSLRFDMLDRKLYLARGGCTEEEEAPYTQRELNGWRVEEDFIDSIRKGTPVLRTSFEQGVRYMRFTEAVHKSWSEGNRKVELESL